MGIIETADPIYLKRITSDNRAHSGELFQWFERVSYSLSQVWVQFVVKQR